MSNKPIGPSFSYELEQAGLLMLPFSWTPDGAFYYDPLITPEQKADIEAVYAAHDPNASAPLPATPKDANARIDAGILAALTVAVEVRNSLHALPTNFNAANFQLFLLQAKILSDAFVAMLQAQAQPPPP